MRLPSPVASGIVDVHSHLLPRWYLDRLKARDTVPFVTDLQEGERFFLFEEERRAGGRLLSESFWEIELKLRFMDQEGIEQTVLTMANPWMDPFDEEESTALSERLNEEFAELEGRTGSRIVGVGVLPNASIDAARAVVRDIGSQPSLYGVVTGGRICGRPFDDSALEVVWEALAEAGVPLFLHPRCGVALDELGGYGSLLPVAVGFPMETTVALSRLLLGGVLHRHPGLRVIAAHGGGAIAFLAARLDAVWRVAPSLQERVAARPSQMLGQLFVDSILYDPRPMRLVAEVVGPDKMLFGTDHPYDISDPSRNREAIGSAMPDHRGAVLGETARRILALPPPGE